MIKKMSLTWFLSALLLVGFSQDINKIISQEAVERVEKILSADNMEGRATFTPALTGPRILSKMNSGRPGFRPFAKSSGFLQEFYLIKPHLVSATPFLMGKLSGRIK